MEPAIDYASPPVLNKVYTSSIYNQIYTSSQLGNEDWVSCNWTTTPQKERKTNNKRDFSIRIRNFSWNSTKDIIFLVCQNSEATTPNGIIEPLVGDAGQQRSCSFSINAPPDLLIQIFCSNVTLNTTADSSLTVRFFSVKIYECHVNLLPISSIFSRSLMES
jgi:hypothetical protein